MLSIVLYGKGALGTIRRTRMVKPSNGATSKSLRSCCVVRRQSQVECEQIFDHVAFPSRVVPCLELLASISAVPDPHIDSVARLRLFHYASKVLFMARTLYCS